jgi:O-6-methylguanine DNA methyltransferase
MSWPAGEEHPITAASARDVDGCTRPSGSKEALTANHSIGRRSHLAGVSLTDPLDFSGTPFQKRVWAELLNIPFGQTRTYAEIANAIGKPRAFCAVGAANGKNPISIVTPCHRVIGKDGSLTGFAGGLKAKECLLGIEAA